MNSIDAVLSIQASAGSGKTYRLAQRFINILSMLSNNSPVKPLLASIVALTFTNKAADEMKDRVIEFLKILAKIGADESSLNQKDFNIEQKDALNLLVEIIKHLGDLNITTIDSFMNKILKAFAVDLGINPDYDIYFDGDKLFDYAFDNLINNKKNKNLLEDHLRTLLTLGENGFNGENIIRKNLYTLANKFNTNNISIADETKIINLIKQKLKITNNTTKDVLSEIRKQIENEIKAIQNTIQKSIMEFNGNKIKTYNNLSVNNLDERIERLISIVETGNISPLLKKNGTQNKNSADTLFNNIKDTVELYKYGFILNETHKFKSTINVLKELNEELQNIKSSMNIVDIQEISQQVGSVIKQDKGVSYAFLKLGETINHFLIDEFQDTSKDQFEAIYPLIQEAVSQGGTLFNVGDKKQAIYGWRGGDYKIFDYVEKAFSSTIKTLCTNHRSKKKIVDFNNSIFNENNLKKIISSLETNNQILTKEISAIYKNSSQQSTDSNKNGGYIEVAIKESKDSEEIEDFYKEKTIKTLQQILKHSKPNRIMILLRKTEQIKKVAEWLSLDMPSVGFITEDALLLNKHPKIKSLLLTAKATLFLEDSSYTRALEEIGINIDLTELSTKAKELSPYEFFVKLLSKYIDINDNLYLSAFMEEVLELTQQSLTLNDIIDTILSDDSIKVKLAQNTDALKIMTIHKAKGLEAETVILPFYDFKFVHNMDLYGLLPLDDFITNGNDNTFLKITKKITALSQKANEIYTKEENKNFIESLNLMYVANTRAKKNLFIFGSKKPDNKKALTKSSITPSLLLFYSLGMEKQKQKQNQTYTYSTGKPCESYNINLEPKNKVDLGQLTFSSNIKKFLKIFPEVYEINSDQRERLSGELFHLTMSFIGKLTNNEHSTTKSTLEKAYNKATASLGYEDNKVFDWATSTIQNLSRYFFEIEEVFNEKELVDKDGNILRPDRIVRKSGKYIVIDYKTGKRSKKHIQQIKDYVNLFDGQAKGIIYYVKDGEIKSV